MDVYKIGVSLAMTSNVAGVMQGITSHMLGVHSSLDKLQGKFNRLHLAIGGGLAAAGGIALLGAFDKVAKHGEELLDQQNKLIRAGRSHQEVADLTGQAFERIARAVPTAAVSDILRAANQLAVVKGSFEGGIAAAAQALKIEALLGNVTGKSAEGSGHALWRSIEMKGMTAGSPEQQAAGAKLLETFVQNIAAAGGKLTANDYQNMAKRGGYAWAHAAPEFLAGPMSVVAADLGGDTAGTTMATFAQFLTGATTMSKQQYQVLEKLKMIDPSKVSVDKGGRINAGPGAIIGGLQYQGDFYNWVQKVLLPHFEAAGIHEGPMRDALTAKIGRNRNATRMLTMFSDPEFVAQIKKDIDIFRKSLGLDKAYDEFTKNDPKGVRQAFDAQYKSMMEAIGGPAMQAAMPIMKQVTSWFSNIGELANKHPEGMKDIAIGLGLLGTALTVGGGAALALALGPAGWFVAGVVALGSAVVAFRPQIQSLQDTMDWAVMAVGKEIASWPERLAAAITGMGAAIVGALGNALKSIGERLAPNGVVPGGISYQGGEGLGGLIHSASLGTAANLNLPGVGIGGGLAGTGDAAGLAERMLGANGTQAASALGSRMTPGEWCADFVNGVLKNSGGDGVKSSMARAFSSWGHAVGLSSVARNDVILEKHGDHIGHVGLATGRVQRDLYGNIKAVEMISGNYGHSVRKNWESIAKIGGLRRGNEAPAPDRPTVEPYRSQKAVTVQANLHMDGRRVASVVTKHQFDDANGPARGSSLPDGTLTYPQVA